MQSAEQLRKEIRAIGVEKALSGYEMVCCLEDIPDEETQEMLTGRVLRTITERLTRRYDWDNIELLWVLAEEAHRIVEALQGRDAAMLGKAMEFVTMATSGRPN
jgi:hypothetical protein